ncbi:MAG: hypothetical protein Q9223_004315 [Gallowayella weberi]
MTNAESKPCPDKDNNKAKSLSDPMPTNTAHDVFIESPNWENEDEGASHRHRMQGASVFMIIVFIASHSGICGSQTLGREPSGIPSCGLQIHSEMAPVIMPAQSSVWRITVEVKLVRSNRIEHRLSRGLEVDRSGTPVLAVVTDADGEVASISNPRAIRELD